LGDGHKGIVFRIHPGRREVFLLRIGIIPFALRIGRFRIDVLVARKPTVAIPKTNKQDIKKVAIFPRRIIPLSSP
jgi:hypothetical protein